MEETQKVFDPVPPLERDETIVHEPDATLTTPRFDEVEAQVARPVVPLSARPSRVGGGRQWPIALVLISALAGGVVSILAFRLYQQRQQQQTQVSASEVVDRTQPAEDASASPTPLPEGVASTATGEQGDAPVVFEEFDPAKEGGRVSDAAPPSKANVESARTPERKDEAKDEARDDSKPNARLVETLKSPRTQSAPAPRQIEARHEDVRREDERADEDFYERRRERRRQRREQRREQRRNIDRIKDIFEGTPPG